MIVIPKADSGGRPAEGPNVGLRYRCGLAAPRIKSMHRSFNPGYTATGQSLRKGPLSPASVRVRDDRR
jgi:hypothetical protein